MVKQRKRAYLFYTALAIYMVRTFFVSSNIVKLPYVSTVVFPLHYVSFLLSLAKLAADFSERMISRKQLFGMMVGFLCSTLIFVISGELAYLLFWTLICASFDVDYQVLAKVAALSMLASLVIIYGCCWLGMIDNGKRVAYLDTSLKQRFSLGFDYYFTAAHFTFYMLVTYVYMRRERITWLELIFLVSLQIIVFVNTNTKSPFAVGMVVLLAAALLKISNWLRDYKKLYGIVSCIVHPICVLFIVIASYLFDAGNDKWNKLNDLFSTRLLLGRKAYDMYDLKLFGQQVEMSIEENYFVIDSSYLAVLVGNGIIFFFLVILLLVSMGRASMRRKDTYFALLTTAIAIHATFDEGLTMIPMDILMFFMPYVWGSKDYV